MSFRNQFERIPVKSNSGSRFVVTYKPHYSDTGALDLIEDQKIDVYEQIQSFKESCDIKTILARFAAGDESALNRRLPYFGDFSEMPNSLAGYLQLLADAENTFAQLPADVRANFNNSPSEFFSAIGSPDFDKRMGVSVHEGLDSEPVMPEPVKEVSVDES